MTMQGMTMTRLAAGATLMMAMGGAMATDHPVIKRAVDMPPPADLAYKITAKQKGISLGGSALVSWRVSDTRFSASNVSNAQILGKILENRSEGVIDEYGLAPLRFTEKRFRKDPTTAVFDRTAKQISFENDKTTYPMLGGEQDRGSAQWQLSAVARAAPEKFVAGSEWKFFVVGRRDAEVWTFKVVNRETIRTGMGAMQTVHFSKAPPADSKGQRLDVWLAPGQEWYPVKLRFSDEDGEFVEQVIEKIVKK
jgi:hypothetical protein